MLKAERAIGVRTKNKRGKEDREKCVGVLIEGNFNKEGRASRASEEVMLRATAAVMSCRREPEPLATVCCPSDTHPHTSPSSSPSAVDKQPAALDPHRHKQPG